jgi:uncharacterized protein (DUF433 family)
MNRKKREGKPKPFKGVTQNPDVCDGEPCIRDTGIPLSEIYWLLGRGNSPAEILKKHPQLKESDIKVALRYFYFRIHPKLMEREGYL